MAIIDSLIAKLSFDFDDKALRKFDEGMKNASKIVAAVAAGAVAAGTAIFAFTSKIAEQNDKLGKLAQTIGVTSQAINELGYVAQLNGGSTNAMNISLENLAKTSSEAAMGLGAGVEAFGRLGVSIVDTGGNIKKADQLLLDVSDSIAQLNSQSKKLELLNKLGIDSSLLLSLEQGSAAIRAQRQEVEDLGFVLDKDATASAAKFNDEMLRIKLVIAGVASSIGTKLMKQITPLIKSFLQWFKVNKEIIKQNIGMFLEKLTKTLNSLFNIGRRVFNVVNSIVRAFGGWVNVIGIISVALMAMNARILLIPTLILAAGAAIFLLVEDMVAFANGADSQLGALSKQSESFKLILEGLVGIFTKVSYGWGLIFSDGKKALDGLIILVKDIGSTIFNFMISPINQAIGLLNNLPGVNVSQIHSLSSNTSGYSPGTTNGNITNSNTNDITININGGNIDQVKQAVSEALAIEFKTSELNMSTQIGF